MVRPGSSALARRCVSAGPARSMTCHTSASRTSEAASQPATARTHHGIAEGTMKETSACTATPEAAAIANRAGARCTP